MEPGTNIGTFEVTGLLGKDGMGEVYRAMDSKNLNVGMQYYLLFT